MVWMFSDRWLWEVEEAGASIGEWRRKKDMSKEMQTNDIVLGKDYFQRTKMDQHFFSDCT